METLFRGKNMIEIERISKKIWSKSTQKQNEYYFSSNKNVKGNKNKDIDQISLVGTVWSRTIHARILRNVLRKKWQSLSFESHLKEHKAEKTATTWYDLSVFQVHIHGHGHVQQSAYEIEIWRRKRIWTKQPKREREKRKWNEECLLVSEEPEKSVHSSNVFLIVLSRDIEIEKQPKMQQLFKQRPNRMIALKTNTQQPQPPQRQQQQQQQNRRKPHKHTHSHRARK